MSSIYIEELIGTAEHISEVREREGLPKHFEDEETGDRTLAAAILLLVEEVASLTHALKESSLTE